MEADLHELVQLEEESFRQTRSCEPLTGSGHSEGGHEGGARLQQQGLLRIEYRDLCRSEAS